MDQLISEMSELLQFSSLKSDQMDCYCVFSQHDAITIAIQKMKLSLSRTIDAKWK